MKDKINEIANNLRTNLKNSFNDFEGLYVFGSQVNGKATDDSDIDVVAIIDASDDKKRGVIWDIVGKIEYDYNVICDLHPMTRAELERNYIFHNEVVNKGVFYEASK
jgi:predicted nucleotidyltransferase